MSSIERFYKTEFSIKRNTWVDESGYSYSAESTIGTFMGHLQQARAELIENLNLNFTNTFTIWCASASGVLVGDRLTAGSNSYSVRAIQDNTSVGTNKHFELIVERDIENGS